MLGVVVLSRRAYAKVSTVAFEPGQAAILSAFEILGFEKQLLKGGVPYVPDFGGSAAAQADVAVGPDDRISFHRAGVGAKLVEVLLAQDGDQLVVEGFVCIVG